MIGWTQRDAMLDLYCQLEHRMGRIVHDPFRTTEWTAPEATTTTWLPPVDIFEEPETIRLVAEIPGVRLEDVKISVEANLLTIQGTKQPYGAFERTFRLSASIDATRIKATYNLGVLTLTLPKAETAKPHLIAVEVMPEKALTA